MDKISEVDRRPNPFSDFGPGSKTWEDEFEKYNKDFERSLAAAAERALGNLNENET